MSNGNELYDIYQSLDALNGKKVNIGVSGEQAWLAHIHEFGCNITAKKSQYLTIPCNSKAKGKKASDFPDLFVYQAKDGSLWLIRNKGADEVEFMFALKRSVRIPERSFLRGGFEQHKDEVNKKIDMLIPDVIDNTLTAEDLCKTAGILMSSKIKDYARNINIPNSPLTKETKGSSKPLIDTGDMINAISYEVE